VRVTERMPTPGNLVNAGAAIYLHHQRLGRPNMIAARAEGFRFASGG
jgi:hypothetical protein